MLILSVLSIPVLSGHKSGHILFRTREEPSTNGVGFSCAKWASNQRVRGGADMVINQMINR